MLPLLHQRFEPLNSPGSTGDLSPFSTGDRSGPQAGCGKVTLLSKFNSEFI